MEKRARILMCAACTVVVTLALGTTTVAQNLLLNPSFEAGIYGTPSAASGDVPLSTGGPWMGWNNWSNPYSGYYTQTITAEDGVQCAKTFSGPNAGVYQSVAVTVGTTYNATAWFVNSSADQLQGAETDDLRLLFKSGTNGTGTVVSTFVSSLTLSSASTLNAWTQLSVSAPAPAGAVSVVLMGYFNNPNLAAGGMFMDNASLVAVPEPSAVGLVLTSLGGLVMFARRRHA